MNVPRLRIAGPASSPIATAPPPPTRDSLSPAQQSAFDALLGALDAGSVFVLGGSLGAGKTLVLEALHHRLGGALLDMRDFMAALRERDPLALEDAFEALVAEALRDERYVFVDDLHVLTAVVDACGMCFYPKNHLIEGPLKSLARQAQEDGRKLVFALDGSPPEPLHARGLYAAVDDFTAADYRHFCEAHLGREEAAGLDFGRIFRFAPKLNAHQIVEACAWVRQEDAPETDRFIDYLRRHKLVSNVDLEEVQAFELEDLKGVDDVLEALEAHVILPLENDALAAELSLKPKRGVLLAGPPGTGKTTIGRALAHRLRSKFFLIDGTCISGARNFYERVHQVFEAAKQNAPSILFIDDSDVIFESGGELGLYRYLLTMLDGLESESAGRVCVMMTAMDVSHLPPALVRSGRIELWLETRLPDADARAAILRQRLADLPAVMGPVEVAELAEATDGLTGADLKRVVEDAKLLFAHDRARSRPLRRTTDYFLSAVEAVRSNKETYAAAEAQARQRHPQRPSIFDMFGAMGVVPGDD